MTKDPTQPTPTVMPVMFRVTASTHVELGDVWEDDGVIDPSCEGMGQGAMLITARGVLIELPNDPAKARELTDQLRSWIHHGHKPTSPEQDQKALAQAKELNICLQLAVQVMRKLQAELQPGQQKGLEPTLMTFEDLLTDINGANP
jgi:hypothetical protein